MVSKTSDIIFPFGNFNRSELEYVEFETLAIKQVAVSDGRGVKQMCDEFETHRRIMFSAEFAGCGKSFACKAMEARSHEVLFVRPGNKLA